MFELAEHFGESVGGDRIMIRQKFSQPDLAAMAGIVQQTSTAFLRIGSAVSWSARYPATIASRANWRLSTRPVCSKDLQQFRLVWRARTVGKCEAAGTLAARTQQ